MAAEYNAAFAEPRLGRWLRGLVWDRLAGVFGQGDRVLELGCGTGEDAVWLARQGVEVWATDSSPAMIEVARAKAQAVGLDYLVHCGVLDMAALGPDSMPRDAAFDGALSNFGAVNCLPSLRPLVQTLANWIRRRLPGPGGHGSVLPLGSNLASGAWREPARPSAGCGPEPLLIWVRTAGGCVVPITPVASTPRLKPFFRPSANRGCWGLPAAHLPEPPGR